MATSLPDWQTTRSRRSYGRRPGEHESGARRLTERTLCHWSGRSVGRVSTRLSVIAAAAPTGRYQYQHCLNPSQQSTHVVEMGPKGRGMVVRDGGGVGLIVAGAIVSLAVGASRPFTRALGLLLAGGSQRSARQHDGRAYRQLVHAWRIRLMRSGGADCSREAMSGRREQGEITATWTSDRSARAGRQAVSRGSESSRVESSRDGREWPITLVGHVGSRDGRGGCRGAGYGLCNHPTGTRKRPGTAHRNRAFPVGSSHACGIQ